MLRLLHPPFGCCPIANAWHGFRWQVPSGFRLRPWPLESTCQVLHDAVASGARLGAIFKEWAPWGLLGLDIFCRIAEWAVCYLGSSASEVLEARTAVNRFTLPPANMAPDRGSLEEESHLPGILLQMLC